MRFTITDDGPGIPAEERSRIFERFHRTDEARDRRAGGAGLGLAIVHRLVTSNGGSAALSDTPGGGLTVTVTLPGEPSERTRRPGQASD